MVGTLSYGLCLRDASLVILFFCILSTIPPAYFATFGPKTGIRQMIHARYSFGYYLVSVPVLLNLATLTGFCVIDSVVGGQTLSAVGNGNLSPTVGIVIIAILSLLVSFCGIKTLHYYERYAWIPAMIAIIVAVGCGGKHLKQQTVTEAAPAGTILSFGGLVAGFLIPWAALASDFATYMHPNTSRCETSSTPVFVRFTEQEKQHESLLLYLRRSLRTYRSTHDPRCRNRRSHSQRSFMDGGLSNKLRWWCTRCHARACWRIWQVPRRHTIVLHPREHFSDHVRHHAQLPDPSSVVDEGSTLRFLNRHHRHCDTDLYPSRNQLL